MIDVMKVQLLHPEAKAPHKGSVMAAGYDLAAVERAVLAPGAQAAIATGLAIQVPAGTYGRIAPRSGLAAKHGIDVLAGVVDADYRGEIKVILINHGGHTFHVTPGDRIAQLVIEVIESPPVMLVPSLDESGRGENGFGSTGV